MALHNVGPRCLATHASQAVTGAKTEKASFQGPISCDFIYY